MASLQARLCVLWQVAGWPVCVRTSHWLKLGSVTLRPLYSTQVTGDGCHIMCISLLKVKPEDFYSLQKQEIHSKIIWSRGSLNPCQYHSTRVMRTHHYFSDWSNVYFNGLIITHTSNFARKLNDKEYEPDPPVVKYWKAATAHQEEKIVLVFILAELAT